MKTFVRGNLSRALCALLMTLIVLPGMVALAPTPGAAATGGRLNIIVLPFQNTASAAPGDMVTRLVQELQMGLAARPGVEVNLLARNSSIMSRLAGQLDRAGKVRLYECYDDAVNPKIDDAARLDAAAELVKLLHVDAIIYGTLADYTYTSGTSPNQAKLQVLVTKVMLDEEGGGTQTPITVTGESVARPNGKGSQDDHDTVAINNAAKKLSILLTGGQLPAPVITPPPATETPKPKKKKKNSGLFIALGALIVAALAVNTDSGNTSTPIVNLGQGLAYSRNNGVQLWIPRPSSGATSIDIYRQTLPGSTFTRKRAMRAVNPADLLVSLPMADFSAQQIAGTWYAVWTDTTASAPQLYQYQAVVHHGTLSEVDIYNGNSPDPIGDAMVAVGPGIPPPVATLTADTPAGSSVTLHWSMPSTPNNAAVTAFKVDRRAIGDVDWELDVAAALSGAATQCTVTMPLPTTYEFRVIPVGIGGQVFPIDSARTVIVSPII